MQAHWLWYDQMVLTDFVQKVAALRLAAQVLCNTSTCRIWSFIGTIRDPTSKWSISFDLICICTDWLEWQSLWYRNHIQIHSLPAWSEERSGFQETVTDCKDRSRHFSAKIVNTVSCPPAILKEIDRKKHGKVPLQNRGVSDLDGQLYYWSSSTSFHWEQFWFRWSSIAQISAKMILRFTLQGGTTGIDHLHIKALNSERMAP